MAEPKRVQIPLSFGAGVNGYQEASMLGEGLVPLLENYVPEPEGNLRVRRGWRSVSSTGAPATRKARGIGLFTAASGTGYYLVAHNNGSGYDIYRIDRSNLSSNSWAKLETVGASGPTAAVAFTAGLQNVFYTGSNFSLVHRWDGTTVADIPGSPPGRCIAFHKSRLFVGGTAANPTRLWYSPTGDYTVWPATNYIEVGLDDGEPIEDVAPARDGLVIGKANSLWFLSGAGLNDFQLQRLTGGGVAPGRTLMMTPKGVVAAGASSVWLWQYSFYSTSAVDDVSAPIQDTYGKTGAFMSASFVDQTVFICDEGSGVVWALNLGNPAWRLEKVSTAAEAPAVLFNYGNTQLMGPQAATAGSLLSSRLLPGGGRVHDDGLAETYKMDTQELWLAGPTSRLVPRHLFVTARQRGGNSTEQDAALQVTPVYDGEAQDTQFIFPQDEAPKTFRARLDVGHQGGFSAQYQFVQAVGAAESSVMDIERVVLEADLYPPGV